MVPADRGTRSKSAHHCRQMGGGWLRSALKVRGIYDDAEVNVAAPAAYVEWRRADG